MNNEYSDWYVVQTISGKEEEIKNNMIKFVLPKENILLPKRKLLIRKCGEYFDTYKSLFPGYLFYKGDFFREIYSYRQQLKGFIKIINENFNPIPLYINEIDRIINMINNNEIIEYSDMIVEGDKVKVIAGPLVGQEGIIKMIDKRKQRVKIALSLFGCEQEVQLSFRMVDKISLAE